MWKSDFACDCKMECSVGSFHFCFMCILSNNQQNQVDKDDYETWMKIDSQINDR